MTGTPRDRREHEDHLHRVRGGQCWRCGTCGEVVRIFYATLDLERESDANEPAAKAGSLDTVATEGPSSRS